MMFPTSVWHLWSTGNTYCVQTPSGRPLSFPFLFIPINADNTHWLLCVVAYASDLWQRRQMGKTGPIRTAIIFLDSAGWHGGQERGRKIRRLLMWLSEKHQGDSLSEEIMSLPIYTPTVSKTKPGRAHFRLTAGSRRSHSKRTPGTAASGCGFTRRLSCPTPFVWRSIARCALHSLCRSMLLMQITLSPGSMPHRRGQCRNLAGVENQHGAE